MVTSQYTPSRRETILADIRSQTSILLGFDDPSDLDINTSLLEMGADSIAMMEAVAKIKKTYGVPIAIRQFFEDLTNIDALATYIDNNIPQKSELNFPQPIQPIQEVQKVPEISTPQPIYQQPPQANQEVRISTSQENYIVPNHQLPITNYQSPITPVYETQDAVGDSVLEKIMRQQLQIMSQQLEIFRGYESQPVTQQQVIAPTPIQQTSIPPTPIQQTPIQQTNSQPTTKKPAAKTTIAGPSELRKPKTGGLTAQQKQHILELTETYTKKTATSKKLAQKYRPVLADSRASVGFRPSVKEMLYPLVAERSEGARVWDVDGNEYLDLTMGQGVLLFGHQPDFIMDAIKEQLELGIQLHPRYHLAGEVAELIKELTGVERVCFSNSGTEAVITSLRIARAGTGKTKIVMFEGAYHGHGDYTLVRREVEDGIAKTVAFASGVPASVAEDMVVLDYDSPESLAYIEANAHELAAVLVEPVQSNRLSLQPKEFLIKLREVTERCGVALVFDEVTTGFRFHPGGAQAWLGIQADIVNYGKVMGGGMPIGVIAGKAKFLDAVDGGMWNYGDNSFPEVERTFFGGTFCMHPLAMVSTKAVLQKLKDEGLALQERLHQKTKYLATTLNNYFVENDIPIEVEYFSSIFRFSFTQNLDPFFYHLINKGLYVWEWRKYFLSTAHTDADIEFIIKVVKETIEEMKAGGFFLTSTTTSNGGKKVEIQELKNPEDEIKSNQNKGFWVKRSVHKTPEITIIPRKPHKLEFSLFYFGNYNSEFNPDKYSLLFSGAKFADEHGFSAVWLPERHFHDFGGFSPNPSVLSAALARETKQVKLRAGSVVLPLHHPIRVAEEWSVIDNLSQGRVGIAFASGWHENDFVFAPDAFGKHRELMFTNIEKVQKLWHGEKITVKNGTGNDVELGIYPQPMQSELPIWITIVNNPDTYIRAGEIGAGILTNLMGQKIEDLARNIQLYRQALLDNGHDINSGHVTVLLHTLVGEDLEITCEKGRQPMYNYMTSSIGLFKSMMGNQGLSTNMDELTDDDKLVILESGYKRYVENSALIGTPESCIPIIEKLRGIGVDEISCLIDFGAEEDVVLESLPYVNQIREYYQNQTEKIPLTEAQKQLWFLDKLGEDSAVAYVDSLYAELKGNLDIALLQESLNTVINRHEALRTRIDNEGEFQEILPFVNVGIEVIDFTHLSGNAQETEIKSWLEAQFKQRFDLTQAPLFQVYLLKLDAELHRLVAKIHHIIADGWSVSLVLQEVTQLYSAKCQRKFISLPKTKQFQDYSEWQNQQSQTVEMQIQESYWLNQFANDIPVLNLPTDRPHPAMMSYRGNRQSWKLDSDLTKAIKQVSKKQGCTLFMTLLAAYKVLLHRLSGNQEIVVGIPTSGRSFPGSENIVGYCVHLLPIKSSLDAAVSFGEYLKNIRAILLDGYEHQDYPFSTLLNKLDLHRDFSRPALVSAAFNLDLPLGRPTMFGVEMSFLSPPKIPLAYDIYLTVTDANDELFLDCGYNLDVFNDETIQRWLHHFQNLLTAIVQNPQQLIREIPLLTSAEQLELLVTRNQTEKSFPADKCLHQLFSEQVEKYPDSSAVVFANQRLSYQELEEKSNQLAHYLQSLAVKPEEIVGLCVERSLDMIVGLLGILKAGAAYLPLDPSFPKERLTYMLEDAKVNILLTQTAVTSSIPSTTAKIITLDSDSNIISKYPTTSPVSTVKPDNLAYVIYTSGSTGQPKGVMIEHHSIVNYTTSIIDQLKIEPGSSFLLISTVSADLGNTMIFPALCTGGQLHILSWDEAADAKRFSQYVAKNAIDYIKAVPSHLIALQNPAKPTEILPRKGLILGGEATSLTWVKNILEHKPNCRIYNHYGPTETTVGVLTYQVNPKKPLPEIATLPLQNPIYNTHIYLLDDNLKPVPVGVPGEIYIGGLGVARGYLNQPELTTAKFIDKDDERLYKTGDLARYLPSGEIEFIGRVDNQVKVRGFRVELKDIESVITQHPDIETSTVILTENQQLAAYVVPHTKRNPIINGMNRYKLPNNMYVAHLNKNETDYIYREIFELQAYLRHGITINPGDCVFDVGCNIGLFGLFISQICPELQIYAFEPNPTIYKIVKANLSLYSQNGQVFNCGIADKNKTAEFTFFPGFSLLSGFYADAEIEKEVVKNFVNNQQDVASQDFLSQADAILESRFKAQTFTAQLRTLSEVIAEQKVTHIDLLKINVEKSEFDVLQGIEKQDWAKIRQLVVEVDVKENLDPIVNLLTEQGYDLLVDQDVLLTNTELCYIYAIRPSEKGKLVKQTHPQSHILEIPIITETLISSNEIKEFVIDKLPEYMLPTAFVLLDKLPLTANGKIDKKALPLPGQSLVNETQYVMPENDTEKTIVEIWQEVLKMPKVGRNDNFFDLGGNSLLLIQVHRKLQEQLVIELPVVEMFSYPTVKALSSYIMGLSNAQEIAAEQAQLRAENRSQGKSVMMQRRQKRGR
ncbi:amino acid adenylation domain-containing protein [Anabaena sp. FACHB-1237]|uniref:non-ribosomal peptide synthetase n=1 Tax=Anabaena sp. FACHB-1237 TaxID=2692769 RepID=UPI001680DE6D|nr:non-ribosomal peptide synthetase [Anabaena sp. FACHB-1237]MBD2137713.1 amino acid adenylation domain-containing protein [Anabaena sp. FACHB-1237]